MDAGKLADEGKMDGDMDALLDVEEQMILAGFQDGVARGNEAGMATGWQMGLVKGRELGAELGQYHGRAEALLALVAIRPQRFTERCALDRCRRLELASHPVLTGPAWLLAGNRRRFLQCAAWSLECRLSHRTRPSLRC